jgi:hypothetical protein
MELPKKLILIDNPHFTQEIVEDELNQNKRNNKIITII